MRNTNKWKLIQRQKNHGLDSLQRPKIIAPPRVFHNINVDEVKVYNELHKYLECKWNTDIEYITLDYIRIYNQRVIRIYDLLTIKT
jgi:hypothetical protein